MINENQSERMYKWFHRLRKTPNAIWKIPTILAELVKVILFSANWQIWGSINQFPIISFNPVSKKKNENKPDQDQLDKDFLNTVVDNWMNYYNSMLLF